MFARASSCIVLAALLVGVPLFAYADVIDTFIASIHLKTDGSAEVTETITYDFGKEQHHGIYRDIPVVYQGPSGNELRIDLDSFTVTDGKLSPYKFETFMNGNDLRIKIGDPNLYVTGKKVYEISYIAHDVVGFFSDHDELYWNATGDEWPIQVLGSGARVYAPASTTQASCYVGVRGSTSTCATKEAIASDGTAYFFVTGRVLQPGEGLTVAIGLPKGVVREPSALRGYWKTARTLLVLLVPVFVFVVLLLRWWRYGRDARGRGTIIPEYDAPVGMTPAVASEIVHERVSAASLSATIIDLAVRGYLKIRRDASKTLGIFESVTYHFTKVRAADDALSEDERTLFDALFKDGDDVSSDTLKKSNALLKARSSIQKSVAARMVADGYYTMNPSTQRTGYVVFGIAVMVAGFMLGSAASSALTVVSFLLSGALVMVFGFIMPAKTQKGVRMKEQLLGLKEYLQIAEKNRLDFHNAPEKSPALFEKLLPFAMVFGVSEAWAKEFEDFYKEPPQWYSGASYAAFSPISFTSDMSSMSTAVAALSAPTSGSGGSGGGGFSGGGFGGGGGGSW